MKNAPLVMADWYKDAVIYELRVRSFADSDGDGVGDFRGLTQKLDYLKDLGVTAIWLLPFYPSPLRDDGYDISDYTSIHPELGTIEDFREFMTEAHRRGLKVITELVLNHTSDQHPWFQRARRAPAGSALRNYYVWSDDVSTYGDARLIFKDFEHSNWAWDATAKSNYWHRFFSHQPDLNFDSPDVRKAMREVLDFWLEAGVDGLRLDAVPYLFERPGTNCENLSETHDYLREFRAYVDSKYSGRMLLAEANQWPDDAAAYFGKGDECHMAFHFPIMPRMFMAIHMEDRLPLVDILEQTPAIPANCQWALFLRNHDELTLEMVTDEERDYMYKVYANEPSARINLGIRRRLAPLLGNHRRKIELMNGLLYSLPGTPVLYYGDEIGMGDNIYLGDRNGVRTPMQWSSDKNAGFSRANPQKLMLPIIIDPEYHYEAINVEAQQANPHSLLRWTKRLLALRSRHRAFGRGDIHFLTPNNPKVLVFMRTLGEETVLVVANLSRFVQYVELDLSTHKGMRPVEMFGHVDFPLIGELPYFITLGPHAFYWFSLEKPRVALLVRPEESAVEPALAGHGDWSTLVAAGGDIENVLPRFMSARRWFAGKSRQIRAARVTESIPLTYDGRTSFLLIVQVEYLDGSPEEYFLPVTCLIEEKDRAVAGDAAHSIIARVDNAGPGDKDGLLIDASADPGFCRAVFQSLIESRQLHGIRGAMRFVPTSALRSKTPESASAPVVMKGEQSNTSIRFADDFMLKLVRKIEPGVSSDEEISRFLTERARFPHLPPLAGEINYKSGRGEPTTIALLSGYVPNLGDAWQYALDSLRSYLADGRIPSIGAGSLFEVSERDLDAASSIIGPFLQSAKLLGRRTAELHLALASDVDDPNFRPEPFSPFSQRSFYQSLRGLNHKVFSSLAKKVKDLPPARRAEAEALRGMEERIHNVFMGIRGDNIRATQIRCHGDYHLGQVLFTGHDFIIIDFEGEPARSIGERRLKRSPLRDVAGMIRSFHYAAYAELGEEPDPAQERRAIEWYRCVSGAFLQAYREVAGRSTFIPPDRKQTEKLLNVFLLEKAVYELGYELNNRPGWIHIPIRGIRSLMPDEVTAGRPS